MFYSAGRVNLIQRRYLSSSVSLPQSIGIVGSGQMGTGIAKIAITNAKIPVILMDVNQNVLKKSYYIYWYSTK